MKEAIKKFSKIEIDRKIIYFIFPILIVIAKAIRYTVMKESLVDEGIGHFFLIDILNGNSYFAFDGSRLTIFIFSLINKVFNFSTYLQFEILITIIWNLILFFIIFKLKKKLNLFQFLFIIASIAVLNIFDFCLAKEPLQMLFFIAIYLIICSKNNRLKNILKFFLTFFIFLAVALLFRKYYVLIAFLFMLIYIIYIILKKINLKRYNFIIAFVFILLAIFIFLIISSIFMPNQYKELVRVKERISMADSAIHGIAEKVDNINFFILIVDYVVVSIKLLFPIELIFLGIKYLPYIFYQFLISYFVIKSMISLKQNDENKNLALFAYLAFLIGSSMFEPDFGSWIRHEAVFCPILFIICGAKNIVNRKESKEN